MQVIVTAIDAVAFNAFVASLWNLPVYRIWLVLTIGLYNMYINWTCNDVLLKAKSLWSAIWLSVKELLVFLQGSLVPMNMPMFCSLYLPIVLKMLQQLFTIFWSWFVIAIHSGSNTKYHDGLKSVNQCRGNQMIFMAHRITIYENNAICAAWRAAHILLSEVLRLVGTHTRVEARALALKGHALLRL